VAPPKNGVVKVKKEWIGKHYLSGETISILVKNGTVQEMREADVDTDIWIGPGLIDVQVNGFGSLDLNGFETTSETVKQITSKLNQYGVTRFCPTIVTGPTERMHHCLKVIAEACEKDLLTNYSIIGIHVEGPFLSSEDGPRGAHNGNWIRNPDWDEFLEWQKVSDRRIKKVTLAPEKPGAIEFIEKLSKSGIIPALGHTNATETDIQNAVAAGAKMSTHLGNGSHPYIKRHPNYIWSQLAMDELWASFIADGFHLPPSTLKAMIRSKGNKAILTSDSVHLAGMSPGRYKTNYNQMGAYI
jgi:N-acetylglucosamine-6-phosphate deacetylase